VILYNIADGVKTRIPNPGAFQYAPSVSPDGTVTFARSASGCGNRVRLLSSTLDGPATVLWQIPSGGDVGTTRVYVNANGDATLYFDNFGCGQRVASDVWQILEQGAIQLTVKVEGSGSVTSSPSGIDCGSDCTETYDGVTGVTLTAMPEGGSTFAGWGGACTGTSTTCTLTMNASKSVTATFTLKQYTLVVSPTGDGKVTGDGIDCGTNTTNDCTQVYNHGTPVTLTAEPNSPLANAVQWGSDCSGTELSCMLTMDGDKMVSATFTLI
jgi:uncharacterized repeat protein (TIGR02543 family)